MTSIKIILCLISLLASSNAANLRGNKHRELKRSLTANVLNALIKDFGPALEGMVRQVLVDDFDPISVGDEETVELGSVTLPVPTDLGPINIAPLVSSCETSASATYGIGTISGLSSFHVNTLELVPGSETIRPVMFGLGGAKWSGTWILNATFATLNAEAGADVHLKSCLGELPIEQFVTGTTTLEDPSLEVAITIGGETSSLIRFAQSSQITKAQMQELDFELGSVSAGFDTSGNVVSGLDWSQSFNTFLLNEFLDTLEPLMTVILNHELTLALPIGL